MLSFHREVYRISGFADRVLRLCLNICSAPRLSTLNLNYFVRLFDLDGFLGHLGDLFLSRGGFFGGFRNHDLDRDSSALVLGSLGFLGLGGRFHSVGVQSDLNLSGGFLRSSFHGLGLGGRFRGLLGGRLDSRGLFGHGLLSRFFRLGSGEVHGIQRHKAIGNALAVLRVLIRRDFFLVQVGQAGVLDVESLDLTADIRGKVNGILRGQLSLGADTVSRVNDRFLVHAAGDFLQLFIGKHVAGGDLGQASHEGVHDRLLDYNLDGLLRHGLDGSSLLFGGGLGGFLSHFHSLDDRRSLFDHGQNHSRFHRGSLGRGFLDSGLSHGRSFLSGGFSGRLGFGRSSLLGGRRSLDRGGRLDDRLRFGHRRGHNDRLRFHHRRSFHHGRGFHDRSLNHNGHFFHDRHVFTLGEHAHRDAREQHGHGKKKAQPFTVFHLTSMGLHVGFTVLSGSRNPACLSRASGRRTA